MQTVTGALAGSRRACCGFGASEIVTSLAFGILKALATGAVPEADRFPPEKQESRLNLPAMPGTRGCSLTV